MVLHREKTSYVSHRFSRVRRSVALIIFALGITGFVYASRLFTGPNLGGGTDGVVPQDVQILDAQEAAKGPLLGVKRDDNFNCIAFSRDGKMVALGAWVTASIVRTMPTDIIRPSDIKLWDATTRLEIAALKAG
jgi:hypothetical protein